MTKKAETPKAAKSHAKTVRTTKEKVSAPEPKADASKKNTKAETPSEPAAPKPSEKNTKAETPSKPAAPIAMEKMKAAIKIEGGPASAAGLEQMPAASAPATPTAPKVPAPPTVEPAPATSPVEPAPTAPPPPTRAEPLELPRGALIVMRKSGGLKFTSLEVVIYPDGRVTFGGGDNAKHDFERAARRLLDVQIVRMRRALESSGFFRMKSASGHQPPDGYAYELAARVGIQSNLIEFFTGGIPASLTALVEQLTQWLPSE